MASLSLLVQAPSVFVSNPSPANSSVPCAIVLLGNGDTSEMFKVTVMDDASTPAAVVGATVTVDFSGTPPRHKAQQHPNGCVPHSELGGGDGDHGW